MKLVLFPATDDPPVVYLNPRSVTVIADQVLIEDAGGTLYAYLRRDISELTMDLTRVYGGQDPFLSPDLHDHQGVQPERQGDGEGDSP